MAPPRSAKLSVLCVYVLVAASVAGQQCRHIQVANVKSIFAITPSPSGADVLFYGSAEEAEGELVTGNVFRLRLDGAAENVWRLQAPDASNPPAPVWQSDGSSAYIETDQGIYELQSQGKAPELLWKGVSEGLAISPDGVLLAFWRVEKAADTLVLYDLKKHSQARTWQVPDHFESDKSGWDLAFAHDSQVLYVRTYEEPSNTPLKKFDIGSGRVEAVSPDCYAVAGSKKGVYFIAASGPARSLQKIDTTTGRPRLVARNFPYDSLLAGGNPRWLVSQDYRSKEIVIVDTETDAIRSVGKHESASVLSDGKLLVVAGSGITVGDASCESNARP